VVTGAVPSSPLAERRFATRAGRERLRWRPMREIPIVMAPALNPPPGNKLNARSMSTLGS